MSALGDSRAIIVAEDHSCHIFSFMFNLERMINRSLLAIGKCKNTEAGIAADAVPEDCQIHGYDLNQDLEKTKDVVIHSA
jgi:hypothetical protein